MIRVMVYEDDDGEFRFVKRPEAQPVPYTAAAENMRRYWREISGGEVVA